MATGGGVGGSEYYRVLVAGIPDKSNAKLLLKTRLQSFPGEVVDIHIQGTSNAVVTLRCPTGHSYNVPPMMSYLNFGGSPLTIHNLGTERCALVMENIPQEIAKKYYELAPVYNVVFQEMGHGFSLSGLIDNIYNLRSEVDAVMLWTAKQHVPQPTAL